MSTPQELRKSKEAYWQPHIDAWLTSGIKTKIYCANHQLNHDQFKYWQYQLAPNTKKTNLGTVIKPVGLFSEVKMPSDDSHHDDVRLELVISPRYLVKIPSEFNAQTLLKLLSILEGRT